MNTHTVVMHSLSFLLLVSEVFEVFIRAESIVVSGTAGEDVAIQCPYPKAHERTPKYFCRDPCNTEDVLVPSKNAQNETRYSLHDNPSGPFFTVTIRRVTLKDSGTYYCGLDQWGKDTLTKILLIITEGHQEVDGVSHAAIILAVNSVLLVSCVLVFVVIQCRCRTKDRRPSDHEQLPALSCLSAHLSSGSSGADSRGRRLSRAESVVQRKTVWEPLVYEDVSSLHSVQLYQEEASAATYSQGGRRTLQPPLQPRSLCTPYWTPSDQTATGNSSP
ncbi:CMRF35-like molecule 8 [Alosa sapidissima]|uniref:CMRF35-like molecule 8 n=1 Tax=Alosa sapidissima TaxID=34773 RepID=UPI001C0A2C1C|nr:CMRF35-like molecule 8 [Alosa sapidissima]